MPSEDTKNIDLNSTNRSDWPQVAALKKVGKQFYDRSWSLATSSNYSVVMNHQPLKLLITASGKDKGDLQDNDFLLINESGKAFLPNDPKPSAESLLHVAAAIQPGVGAVLHTHSIWSTILSDLYLKNGGFEIAGYEMLKGLSGIDTHESKVWIEIFPNTQNIADLANTIEKRFKDKNKPLQHGYLIHQHGLYTWGKDLAEAKRHVEALEFLFEVLVRKGDLNGSYHRT